MYIIAGFLTCILLIGSTMVFANPERITRELSFGVNVVVDGVPQSFSHDMRPFTIDGRTFLPVRSIADVLSVDVEWDATTQTVFLATPGSPAQTTALPPVVPVPTPVPPSVSGGIALLDADPSFESSISMYTGSTQIRGDSFENVLYFLGGSSPSNTWSQHNLDGRFSTLTGTIATMSAGNQSGSSHIKFIGDGRELHTWSVSRVGDPRDISVDVSGVSILRIEMNIASFGAPSLAFYNAMIE